MDELENVVVQPQGGHLGRRGGRRSYFQLGGVRVVESGLGMKDREGTPAVLRN